MAETIYKGKWYNKLNASETVVLYPETTSDQILHDGKTLAELISTGEISGNSVMYGVRNMGGFYEAVYDNTEGWLPSATVIESEENVLYVDLKSHDIYAYDPQSDSLVYVSRTSDIENIKAGNMSVPKATVASKATADANGLNIADNYALKTEVPILDSNNLIPNEYLPSYVDDVVEVIQNGQNFEVPKLVEGEYLPSGSIISAETSKIYVDVTNNKTYRWSGTAYVEISASLALGETSSTAYAGNKGKANADAITALQAFTLGDLTNNIAKLDSTVNNGLYTYQYGSDPVTYLLIVHAQPNGVIYQNKLDLVTKTLSLRSKTSSGSWEDWLDYNLLSKNDVVNNLTSSSTNTPLSAAQGKMLKEHLIEVGDTVGEGPSTSLLVGGLFFKRTA